MKTILPIWQALASLAVILFTFAAPASVFINEVCADNEEGFNVDGEFPDYIELFNTNTVSVNISSWRLTVNINQPNRYIFPANTVIPARGFLVVYCDGQTNEPGLHTEFSLSKGGETVTLLGPALGFRDGVRFGFQVTDRPFGRVPDGTGNHVLCRPTPGAPNSQVPLGNRARLRINEWMPSRDTAADWFEIYNPEPNPVTLSLLVFSDRTNILTQCTNKATVTNSWLAGGGFLQFFADDKPQDGHDELDFKLSSGGDQIVLFSQNRSNIFHHVKWPGRGLSNAALNIAYGWLPDGNTNDNPVTFPLNRDTPGDSNFLPIDNVLITEVISHTDLPLEDAIELYNPTAVEANIGGWWLSDTKDKHDKFRIPFGTTIAPGGYKVFYEYLGQPGGFNPSPGSATSFSLNSAEGDDVYLFTADATGKLTGFRRGVDFPAMANGTSYGRYVTSTGESDFVPLRTMTFGSTVTASDPPSRITDFRAGQGAPNAGPAIGPLVINEIMYHPPDIISGTNIFDNELDEYVEIYNISTQPVKLFDPNVYPHYPFQYAFTNTWRLRGEIDFDFPTNVTLGPGRSLIVVNFGLTNTIQLNTFSNKYKLPGNNVQVFGAYRGKLSNGSGTVELERPDAPQGPGRPPFEGFVPYLRVDRVRYDDDPPWPTQPDGVRINPGSPSSLGYVLSRKKPEQYGGDPANWRAAVPSAGRQIISNYVFRVGNVATVGFEGLAGSGYTLLYQDDLVPGGWSKLQDFAPQTTSGPRQINSTLSPGAKRFYRVVTPIQP